MVFSWPGLCSAVSEGKVALAFLGSDHLRILGTCTEEEGITQTVS